MKGYTVVTNQPNAIATVHRQGCTHLGDHPAVTASSERQSFDDGFSALAHAQHSMPSNYGLCGHCLRHIADAMAGTRR
jgi:hypothetical protein